MRDGHCNLAGRMAETVGRALCRLDVLALFPAVTVAAIWLGLDDAVILTAFALPALLALRALGTAAGGARMAETGYGPLPRHRSGLVGREALLAMLDRVAQVPRHDSACILIQIDDWERLADRWGGEAAEDLALRCGERICTALRQDDLVARLGDARFGVVLHPTASLRLGTREAITARLRAVLGEPISIGGAAVRLTASAGHASLMRVSGDVAEATLAAAEAALTEAHRNGPNAVRAYAPGLLRQRKAQADLVGEVEAALEGGEIRPWFQPQVRTLTCELTGFEALARWHHPERGVLSPSAFLPAVDDAGRMDALGQTILWHALDALRQWDRDGLHVPSVSVNFSAGELRNPALADHVRQEVDRFGLNPARLTVEILETVAASSADDAVLTTIAALRARGITLDLDDFGIGQASLSAIRRFGVTRIKIDRSFIIGLDSNPEQQAMVAAILSMAGHLGVQTLAEGVETQTVLALLAKMGCGHVQGYHLARPMPLDKTTAWATGHSATLLAAPAIERRAG